MWFVQVVMPYIAVQDDRPAPPILFSDTMVTGSAHLLPKRKTTHKQAGESFASGKALIVVV